MFSYIEKLRKKPEPQRNRDVLILSLVITAVIAVFWFMYISYRVESFDFSILPEDFEMREDKSISISEALKKFSNGVNDVFDDIRNFDSKSETSTTTTTKTSTTTTLTP